MLKDGFVRQRWRTSVQLPEDLAPYRGRNGRCGLRLPPRFYGGIRQLPCNSCVRHCSRRDGRWRWAWCFRQTVDWFRFDCCCRAASFDLIVLLRMVQRGVADEFLCGGGRTQRGGPVVVIMRDMVVGFDAEAVAVEVAHDFQGFGMVFLGSGFGIACRLERIAFGKFAGQGVLASFACASACSFSAARRYHSKASGLCLGWQRKVRPAGFGAAVWRLAAACSR